VRWKPRHSAGADVDKRYIDLEDGQVHCRIWAAEKRPQQPDLVCLHAVPYSGLHFATIAPLLAVGRRVICPDYPGYGGSDPPARGHSVEAYASTMLQCLDRLPASATVDLLGFHTGCLVGPEMALQAEGRVRRLVLIDVPCFDPDQRQSMLDKTAQPPAYDADPQSLAGAWQTNVASKLDVMDMNRCLELLAEQLRPGTRAHAGFGAAFSYASEERLARVGQPARVIATASMLAGPSRRAAEILGAGTLEELPELLAPALDRGAKELASAAREFLDDA